MTGQGTESVRDATGPLTDDGGPEPRVRGSVRDVLLGAGAGVVGSTVALLRGHGPDGPWWHGAAVGVVVALVVGLLSVLRGSMHRWARRQRAERRREQDLPPEKSFTEEWRDNPVRAAVVTLVGVALLAFGFWIRTR